MAQYLIYPTATQFERSDSKNVFLVKSDSSAHALNVVEGMLGTNLNSLKAAEWTVTALADSSAQDCVIPFAKHPVGKSNGVWPTLLNGDPISSAAAIA